VFRTFKEKAKSSGISRRDRTITGFGKVFYQLSGRASLYTLLQASVNDSTLDERTDLDQNYK